MKLEELINKTKPAQIYYPVQKEPYKKYKSGYRLDDYKPEDPESGNGSSGAPANLYLG